MTEQRPPECSEAEAILRWLVAERGWLAGPVALAQHQIRIIEGRHDQADAAAGRFEHDAVQLAADTGIVPGGKRRPVEDDDDWAVGSVQG